MLRTVLKTQWFLTNGPHSQRAHEAQESVYLTGNQYHAFLVQAFPYQSLAHYLLVTVTQNA